MLETFSKFFRISQIFWSNIIAKLLNFMWITYWRLTFQNQNKPSTEEVNKLKYYNMVSKTMEAFVEEGQKRVQRKAQELAKVDLLHRLLVQQQLQDLQRRRILRLAAARRRLTYST